MQCDGIHECHDDLLRSVGQIIERGDIQGWMGQRPCSEPSAETRGEIKDRESIVSGMDTIWAKDKLWKAVV
jgi:hypothetical protein